MKPENKTSEKLERTPKETTLENLISLMWDTKTSKPIRMINGRQMVMKINAEMVMKMSAEMESLDVAFLLLAQLSKSERIITLYISRFLPASLAKAITSFGVSNSDGVMVSSQGF